MVKIKNLLSVVCALLCFMSAFSVYNNHHAHLAVVPFQNKVTDKDFVKVSLTILTHASRLSDEMLSEEIITLYDALPYDGYFLNFDEKNMNKSSEGTNVVIHISNKTKDTFSQQSFSKDIDWDHFSKKGNKTYLTDDLTDSNAYAHIMPFNKYENGKTTRFGKKKIVYTNIHNFNIAKYQSKNKVVVMNFIIPSAEVAEFEVFLKSKFITPNFDCSVDNQVGFLGRVCGLDLIKSEKKTEQEFMKRMYFNLLANPLEFPKPFLFLSLIALLGVLLLSGFKESKDITVRRLYGNHESKIFQRLFLKNIVSSLLFFSTTLFFLGIAMLDFRHGSTARFCFVLGDIAFYFLLGLVMLMLAFYLIMIAIMRVSALKKSLDARVVLTAGLITKGVLIVILSLNIVKFNRSKFFSDANLDIMKNKPHLKEGHVVEINYSSIKSAGEQQEANTWLFDTVEKYGFDFLIFAPYFSNPQTFANENRKLFYLIKIEMSYDTNQFMT